MSARRSKAFPGIVRDPEILAGEPVIAGTRIPVRSVIVVHQLSESMDDLCEAFPSASREGLEEAIEFYKAHTHEIDHYIELNEREAMASDDVEGDMTEQRRHPRAGSG